MFLRQRHVPPLASPQEYLAPGRALPLLYDDYDPARGGWRHYYYENYLYANIKSEVWSESNPETSAFPSCVRAVWLPSVIHLKIGLCHFPFAYLAGRAFPCALLHINLQSNFSWPYR